MRATTPKNMENEKWEQKPFKETLEGQTHYLDEDGKLVGELTPEELAKWKALPMNAPLDIDEGK